MLAGIIDTVLAMAASPWVLAVLFFCAAIDGIFPPIPSESVVIALTSLSISGQAPNLIWIGLVAATGAFIGDNIAYLIGTKLPVGRLRIFRGKRGRKALAWAEHALARRGAVFIFSARYVPVGRVAVNMTAGAVGYPYRRFVVVTGFAAVVWACYSMLLGASAGAFLNEHPLLGVGVGVALGIALGIGVDLCVRRLLGRRGVTPEESMRPEKELSHPGLQRSR